nr:hypothetical protein [Tanacetum cinerariifolium]
MAKERRLQLPDDLVMPKNIGIYKGLGDLDMNDWAFERVIKNYARNDPISCYMFQQTLADSAVLWLKGQAKNSITCWKDLKDKFLFDFHHMHLEDLQCAGFDHDHYQEATCAYHEEHMMHDCVQLDHVVDSHDEYTYDSNIIMCDQHVRDNEVPVVHSGASSVPTDAFMMIYDDVCEPHDQSVSYPSHNTVVKNSLTAELAIYKEHVELYEQRAKFEVTEREQKINEQLRIVISDRNFKEETLKRDLYSIKLQLASTIKHNK